ncbi:hypothetical protein [Clostridioides difficile]
MTILEYKYKFNKSKLIKVNRFYPSRKMCLYFETIKKI